MSGLIKRQDMVDHVMNDLNADVTERLGHNWRRVNAMSAQQGDVEFATMSIDFFFLEIYASGAHHDVVFESDMLCGDRWTGQYLPGKLNFVQSGADFRVSTQGDATVHQIYFDNSIFDQCAQAMFNGDPDSVAIRGLQGVFDPALKALAEALLEEARRPGVGTDLNADLIAQQMALHILRHQNKERLKAQIDRSLSDRDLSNVIAYLEEQIEDIGGMDTLAALVNMDVFSFTKAFKATTGESPGQFLIQRRLARVKDLLRTTNDTLADITYATGFSNQPHMTSTFTKHFGVSPGKWRKAVRS